MQTGVKRKNFYLDERKIQKARRILGAKNETDTIDKALDLVVFRKELQQSLKEASGKGGIRKIF